MARIFVSSTFGDLEDCREVVRLALRRLRQDDIAMEYYVAEPERPLDACLRDVRQCDLYVGVFAWRYGHIPDGHSQSITELEYRAAVEAGKDCLVFLLSEDAPWPKARMEKGAGLERIEAFRAELAKSNLCSFFDGPGDLDAKVTAAVSNWLQARGQGDGPDDKRGGRNAEPRWIVSSPYDLLIAPAGLVGRAGETARLVEFARGSTLSGDRVLVVRGLGGMGKSALVWSFIHHQLPCLPRDEMPDAVVWWSFSDADGGVDSLLEQVSRLAPGDSDKDSLARSLAAFGSIRLLVVLDGLERQLDAYRITSHRLRLETEERTRRVPGQRERRIADGCGSSGVSARLV